jgi:methyl-accepting chemotaxis protein
MKSSVGMKIGAGFALALIILIIVGAVSYNGLDKLNTNTGLVTHTFRVRENLRGLLQAMTDAETGQRGYIITADQSYLEPFNKGLAEVNSYVTTLRGLFKDMYNSAQTARLDALQAVAEKRITSLKEVLDLQKNKSQEAAKQWILTGGGKQEMDNIRDIIGKMQAEESDLLDRRTSEAAESARGAEMTIIIGTLGALVLLSIVAVVVTRNISGPLREITATAERIAAGDLAGNIANNPRQDEVGALTRSFTRMTDSLRGISDVATKIAGGDLQVQIKPQSERDLLGNAFGAMVENLQKLIAQTADGINVLSTAANQISTSTTQLASSSAQTATSVSEATTTVEEVRQTAQLSSQKSKAVSESAHRMAQISQSGTKSTEETIGGINRIRQHMHAVAESMVRLSEQSQTIGQIVATVEDLAVQSNILAVNASIEAAKAGEHGKGFAVVAQEVRSLAEQSKQATNQVRTILTDIQKATGAAVMATEQGTKAVEAGVKQATDAGQSIQALSSSVAEASQTATQIAASSQQQLVGVDQVASAMESIKQASVQNLTSAKQLEAAAHNLKELGARLKRTVDRYRV